LSRRRSDRSVRRLFPCSVSHLAAAIFALAAAAPSSACWSFIVWTS